MAVQLGNWVIRPDGSIDKVKGKAPGAGLGGVLANVGKTVFESAADPFYTSKEEQAQIDAAKKKEEQAQEAKKAWASYLESIRPDGKAYGTYLGELNRQLTEVRNDPLAKEMYDRYSGAKPSAAELLLKKQQEDNLRQQMATVASARGGINYAALARRTTDNLAALQQKSAQDAAIMRAQEQERMLQVYAQYSQQQRQQQMSILSNAFNANSILQGQQMQYGQALGQVAEFDANLATQAAAAYQAEKDRQQREFMALIQTGGSLLAAGATGNPMFLAGAAPTLSGSSNGNPTAAPSTTRVPSLPASNTPGGGNAMNDGALASTGGGVNGLYGTAT